MATRKQKKSSKKMVSPSASGLFAKVGKNLFAGDKNRTKKRGKSIVQLATILAKMKLKRKINKEKLKGMI